MHRQPSLTAAFHCLQTNGENLLKAFGGDIDVCNTYLLEQFLLCCKCYRWTPMQPPPSRWTNSLMDSLFNLSLEFQTWRSDALTDLAQRNYSFLKWVLSMRPLQTAAELKQAAPAAPTTPARSSACLPSSWSWTRTTGACCSSPRPAQLARSHSYGGRSSGCRTLW
jgi:hypothetical protein